VKARCLPIAVLAIATALPVLAQESGKLQKLEEQILEQKARAEMEKAKAEAAKAKAEAEKAEAEAEKARAEAELAKIEAEKARASLARRQVRHRPRRRSGRRALAGVNAMMGRPAPGAHTHDGFFLRFTVGPGFGIFNGTGHLVTAQGGTDNVSSNEGGQAGGSFSMGGAVAENLILHGDIWLTVFSDEKRGNQLYQEFGTAVIGLGLTYYWMPYNIYLTGSLGFANSFLTLRDRFAGWNDEDRASETARGVGLSIVTGKEWWVSDNWAVGVALQCEFSYAEGEDSDLIFRHGGAKVLFSATYQ
jgi:hypothetical protein